MQPIEAKVWKLVEPGVAELGLRLVRVRLSGGEGNSTLQLMIEPQAAGPGAFKSVGLDECEQVSRMVSALMDVEDPISGAYRLEVSSTGLARPLVTVEDFTRYAGYRAKVELEDLVNGRRRFTGTLMGTKDEFVCLREGEEEFTFPFEAVKKANLAWTAEEKDDILAGRRVQQKATA